VARHRWVYSFAFLARFMPLAATDFVGKGGSYYGHVFENLRSGVPRGLYWSFTVDFGGIPYLGETWDSSLTIEWITLGAREFAGAYPISSASSPRAEASLYLAEHHPVDSWNAQVSWGASSPQCVFDYDARLDFPGLARDPVLGLHFTGRVSLNFDGFIVVPENLFPKPATVDEATVLLRQHFDAPCLAVQEAWRCVFRP
jgi:hypothetical protein